MRSLSQFNIFLSKISDARLRSAIENYLAKNTYRVLNFPASIVFHHNRRGGLFDHTIEVCRIALHIVEMCQIKSKVSIENIMAACILHDLGKMFRYRENKSTNRFDHQRTDIDHADAIVLDFMQQTKYVLPIEICLCILSHDGGYTKSSVHPNTLEASIVASADMISSRMKIHEWKLGVD